MCGRYVLVQKTEVIEQRFNVTAPNYFNWKPNYNIGPGTYAPVITSENPKELQLFQFGLTPFWAKKPMYLFNARTEGDKNKDNNPEYSGSKDIILKPAFRKPIRSQRCLIIADAFIEGTTDDGLKKPYLVYLKNKHRPFAFAGIYDKWINEVTGEELLSFSIITTIANSLLQKIPHQRAPIILPRSAEAFWLSNKTPLTDITKLLKSYDADLMNAYPIGDRIRNPRENDKLLIEPIGKYLGTVKDISSSKTIHLQGMGNRKKYQE